MIGRSFCYFLAFVCFSSVTAVGQSADFSTLRIEKKTGQADGDAIIIAKGKPKRLARHATQAWQIMNGENVLLITLLKPKSKPAEYHLQFMDGPTRKTRSLGRLPFGTAEMSEVSLGELAAAFAFSGSADNSPVVMVADLNGFHGRIQGASAAKFDGDLLRFSAGAESKSLSRDVALGYNLNGIFALSDSSDQYAQFLSDGRSVLVKPDGTFETHPWLTDGQTVTILDDSSAPITRIPIASLKLISGVPAATRLVVRLSTPLSSLTAKVNDPVKAFLISPATIDGKTLLPQGTEVNGVLTKARRVGWAFVRETAAITVEFREAILPDGRKLAIHLQLYQVENSRESVSNGTIQGLRSTATLGHTAESRLASAAAVDPIAYLFTSVAASFVLGVAEPEILYASGTELIVELRAPIVTQTVYPSKIPLVAETEGQRIALDGLVRDLPFRTATASSKKDSDITNLIFIGPAEGLRRAFSAAGWKDVDTLNAQSTFMTIKTVAGTQAYNQAPMSMLLLDGKQPLFTISKTTNTFSSRHHLRVFDPGVNYDGDTVLTSSSTQDIGIAFSRKQKTFIHVIDQYIDNERAKVINDLEFTGCVTGVQLVPRSWVPRDAYNSTGDRLRTDGAAAVIRINDCTSATAPQPIEPDRPSGFQRGMRNTFLILRNDVYRGNLIYSGFSAGRQAHRYFTTRNQLKPDPGAWRKTDDTGTHFKGLGSAPSSTQQSSKALSLTSTPIDEKPSPEAKQLEESHRWDPPLYEIAIHGGGLRYPNARIEAVAFAALPDADNLDQTPFIGGAADQFKAGWTLGFSVTLNNWRWFSNQFTYVHTFGTYDTAFLFSQPDTELIEGSAGLITRQFEYNFLAHLRPNTSRWRPYVAVGPAINLIAPSESTIPRSKGPFRLGAQNIGLFLSAFDFGRTPPLEGGGVYSPGLVYGGGLKYRVHPRVMVSGDYRETWSRTPDFISDSYTRDYFIGENYDATIIRNESSGSFRQRRFSLGLAFTF